MFLNKNRQFFLYFFILCGLSAQIKEQESRSFFFGLINFDKNSTYEDGYWINKWFFSREFAAPINVLPFEVRYGVGATGKRTGSWALSALTRNSIQDEPKNIELESDGETSVEPIPISNNNIWGTSLEIDVGLFNLPHYLIGSSWLNVLTGVSYRTSSLLYPAKLPSEQWSQVNSSWGGEYFFSPKLTEYFLTSHFQYQPFDKWYINFRHSYGIASTYFYSPDRNEDVWDKKISGSGTSSASALGVRIIFDPGLSNQFSVGLDLRYSYTKIGIINDLQNISPIKNFDLQNFGIYLTLATFYGGRKTIGDKAKADYYRKEYSQALEKFNKFIATFPSHTNRYRAEEYISDCEYKIPYMLMKKGVALEKLNKREKALNMYQFALSKVKNDSVIFRMLEGKIEQLALYWMVDAEKILNDLQYIEAYEIVKKVSLFSIQGKKELRRFKSWVILSQGKELQNLGFIGRAMNKYSEALELNEDLIFEVKSLQYKAGVKMANIAKKADEIEEVQLVISALEDARKLAGGIGARNEKLLTDLKEKLEAYDEFKSRDLIEKKMERGRIQQIFARSKKLEIGQSLPEVEALLGEPHERINGLDGMQVDTQLWIYFTNKESLQLSFHNFRLFKIEKL